MPRDVRSDELFTAATPTVLRRLGVHIPPNAFTTMGQLLPSMLATKDKQFWENSVQKHYPKIMEWFNEQYHNRNVPQMTLPDIRSVIAQRSRLRRLEFIALNSQRRPAPATRITEWTSSHRMRS